MRRLIIVLLFLSNHAFALNGDMTEDDFKLAKKYGYDDRRELRQLNKSLARATRVRDIQQGVIDSFESDGMIVAAENLDNAVNALLGRADDVLRAQGHMKLADEIAADYIVYQHAYKKMVFGDKEIGDHPPMSEWLTNVHNKIEGAIGEFWCEFFHFHDIKIINYAVPVVFNPKLYKLEDYKDHFAGHLILGFWWEHHGLAGVVTYWLVTAVCAAGTSGMGAATFACSPIAAVSEHVIDKHLAPPVASRIWKRYHSE
jgi:hypothetical protein